MRLFSLPLRIIMPNIEHTTNCHRNSVRLANKKLGATFSQSDRNLNPDNSIVRNGGYWKDFLHHTLSFIKRILLSCVH